MAGARRVGCYTHEKVPRACMSYPNPPPDPPEDTGGLPLRAWPESARVALGCGSGCVLLVLLQGLLAWLLVSAYFHAPSAAALQISASTPDAVAPDTSFPLALQFRNGGTAPIRVDSVIARPRNLGGVVLGNPQPRPQSTIKAAGSTVWSYSKRLAPGEAWQVHLDARAPHAGEVRGAVVVQANWEERAVRFRVTARKTEQPPAE